MSDSHLIMTVGKCLPVNPKANKVKSTAGKKQIKTVADTSKNAIQTSASIIKKKQCRRKIRLLDPTLRDTEDDDDDFGENEKKQEDNYQNFQELHYPSSDSADDISIQDTDAEEDFRPHENLIKGDFVFVQLKGLKNVHHYIAQIDDQRLLSSNHLS